MPTVGQYLAGRPSDPTPDRHVIATVMAVADASATVTLPGGTSLTAVLLPVGHQASVGAAVVVLIGQAANVVLATLPGAAPTDLE
jgi:hypothetical protein